MRIFRYIIAVAVAALFLMAPATVLADDDTTDATTAAPDATTAGDA